jgi:hypothetical protein
MGGQGSLKGSRRGLLGCIVAAVATLAIAPGTAGAVTFGADLTQDPVNDCNACAGFTVTKTSGVAETGSPINGILTSARVKTRGAAATGSFRVLHPTGNPNEFLNQAEAPVSTTIDATMGGHITEVLTRFAIQMGDRIAIAFPDQDVLFMAPSAVAQCALHIEGPQHVVGTPAMYTNGPCSGPPTSYELLVAGTVEPDADGDMFGDLTQDGCPNNATTHGACPQQPPAPAPKKKCKKKKKHLGAAAAKKKCKKHKK